MNENGILKLIANSEDESLELKKSVDKFDEVLKTACAMANTRGRQIVIGVEERANPVDSSHRFRLTGIPKLRHILNSAHHVGDQLVPQIKTDCETIAVENDRVVLLISVASARREMSSELKTAVVCGGFSVKIKGAR
jgi:predicted HTH transcriptional regulator